MHVPLKVAFAAENLLRSSFMDVTPILSTYPWLSKHPDVWFDGSGPFRPLRGKLRAIVHRVHAGDSWWVEQQFSNWYARNIIDSELRWKYIGEIDFNPRANRTISYLDWLKILQVLLPRPSFDIPALSVFNVPPKSEASNGVTYDPIKDRLFTGPKGRVWQGVMSSTILLQEQALKDERLTWGLTPDQAQQLAEEYYLWYVPFFRFDNPHWLKPRLLWGGDSRSYLMQRQLVDPIMRDIKKSPYFATKPEKTAVQLQLNRLKNGDTTFLQLDFKRYDLHQFWQTLWNLRRAVSAHYHYLERGFERIAVLNAVANVFGPLVIGAHPSANVAFPSSVDLIRRRGIASSGAGDFAPYNSILSAGLQLLALRKLDERYLGCDLLDFRRENIGQCLGDNVYVPTQVGALAWAKFMSEYGFELKTDETLVSKEIVVMLRKIHDLEYGGWSPVVLSLAHKAVTSDLPDLGWNYFDREAPSYGCCRKEIHSQIFKLKYAMSARARLAILGSTLEDQFLVAKKSAWERVDSFFRRYLCPKELLMKELSDKELSDRLQKLLPESTSFLSNFWVSLAEYKVDDTAEYL